jgi:CRP-like cAMP-binding protein
MPEQYLRFLQKYLNTQALEDFPLREYKLINYSKNDIILKQGDECKQVLFLLTGTAISYLSDENGKENTWAVHFNDKDATTTNVYLVDYHSFLTHKPSSITIKALTQCQVMIVGDYEYVMTSCQQNLTLANFGRQMAEEAYLHAHQQIINSFKTAQQRLRFLITHQPYILDKISQKDLASMLNITPQYLAKLNKQMKLV